MASEGLNKVMLIGNVGQDPELRYTQSNQPILNLRIATNESFLNRDNERQERTEWHTVVLWGKRGEALHKFLTKGSRIYVEGRLQTRSWEDKTGGKRYSTEVNATNVILLGGGGGGGGGAGGGGGGGGRGGAGGGGGPGPGYDDAPQHEDFPSGGGAGGGGGGHGGMGDDDIPF